MKKILLGTTAVIALSAMSTQAFAAQKIKLSLGGITRQYVGLINNDEVAPANGSVARAMSFAQYSKTRLTISGSTKLDNGLTVKATIKVDANKGTNLGVYVNYLTIKSNKMGAFLIGNVKAAAHNFRVGAPTVSAFDFDELTDWGSVATSPTTSSTAFTFSTNSKFMYLANNDKSAKVVYISPTFAKMFTVFGSYSSSEGSNLSSLKRATRNTTNDGYSFGVALGNTFSGIKVGADLARFDDNGTGASGVTRDQFGLNVGMIGVTVGGSYTKFIDNRSTLSENDGNAWEMGLAYKTGPYGVSARYTQSKTKGLATTAGDNKDTVWTVAASYDLGAGVTLSANYFNAKANPEGAGATVATGKSTQVKGVIAGIEVGF